MLAEAQTEVQDGVSVLRAIAGEATRVGGAKPPVRNVGGGLALAIPVPLGVAAVITHWVFPLAGCVWAMASILATGNTVVLKPAEDTPLTAARLVEIFLEAGLPPASICLVHGHGEEAGAPLVRHPDVALVSFAGSSEVGREVAITCAAEEKRLCLDLGEESVAILLEDADVDLAVESVWARDSRSRASGGVGAGRLFVHRKAVKEFSERIVARARASPAMWGWHAGDDRRRPDSSMRPSSSGSTATRGSACAMARSCSAEARL